MKCSRPSCPCLIDDEHCVRVEDKTYCSDQCATACTDDRCVCTPCDCSQ
jgi:hypothetical protein